MLNADLGKVNGRWPHFAPIALRAGFRTVDALPMRLRGQCIGALNLFRAEVGEMEEADVEAAQAMADVATIAILQHRAVLEAQTVTMQLSNALASRVVIEQAKGRLAERAGLTMDQAFDRLRKHARTTTFDSSTWQER